MKTTTIIEIIVIIVLAIAFIIYLVRRNIKDEKDINPELTKALKDVEKNKQK
jgi:uncharacterized protein YneF (UPF0154 family)